MEELLKKVKPLREYLSSITKDFETRGDKPKLSIESLPQFNEKLWGLKDGELVVIGGRPSNGKSALAMQLAFDQANQGHNVLFLSLEMDVESLQERLFCNVYQVPNTELRRDSYVKNQNIQVKWKSYCKLVQKLPLLVTCGIGSTFNELLKVVELLDPTPKMIVVDYIQAIRTLSGKGLDDINEYIRRFRQLAIEKKFCGVLVSQINRVATQHRDNVPNISQLKSSGVLEEHADRVVLCYYPYHYNKEEDINKFYLMLEKHRNGNTGTHPVYFRPEFYKFREFSDNEKLMHGMGERK